MLCQMSYMVGNEQTVRVSKPEKGIFQLLRFFIGFSYATYKASVHQAGKSPVLHVGNSAFIPLPPPLGKVAGVGSDELK